MLLQRLRRAAHPAHPEPSLRLRQLVLAAMLVPFVALVRTAGLGLLLPALLATLGVALGHGYSYRHLDKPTRLVRGLSFVALHLALCWMCAGIGIGASFPQAQFAMFAQAITCFDLRYRRSLLNALFISAANLYISATLSRDTEFLLYLALFGGLLLATFYVAEQADGRRGARLLPVAPPAPARATAVPLAALLLRYGLLGVGAIVLVFLFTPRFAGRPLVPPFSLSVPMRGGVKSEIINPGVPLVQINGWSDGSSDYFYGFDSNLDLRYRGGLSDKVVMYVRSPSRSYWRSHSYDSYDGLRWSQSDLSLTMMSGEESITFKLPYDTRGVQEPIVQSFTIVQPQPNLIFAAYRPAEVIIMARSLAIDSGEGIRTPEPLRAGITYSVVSYRPEFNPERLRASSGDYPPAIRERYLQLPPTISERTRALAQSLTAPYTNPFDKVSALRDHLLSNYPYNFFPPPHPPGADVVDNFLFVDKEGVCEHYVTALVVMARSLGIPARLVTGYGSGAYSRLTGYYEVRASDAHSWAEVYFPDYGWVPFDPTPGWDPDPYPTPVQEWFFSAQSTLNLNIPFGAIAQAGMGGIARLAPTVAPLLGLVGVALLLFLGYRRLRGRRGSPVPPYSRVDSEGSRQAILKRYRQALRLLGRSRAVGETMHEYAHRTPSAPLTRLTTLAEIAAYRPAPPPAERVAEAEEALAALREVLRESKEEPGAG